LDVQSVKLASLVFYLMFSMPSSITAPSFYLKN